MVLGILHRLQALGSLDPEEVDLDAVLLAVVAEELPSLSTRKTLGREGDQVRTIIVSRGLVEDTGHVTLFLEHRSQNL